MLSSWPKHSAVFKCNGCKRAFTCCRSVTSSVCETLEWEINQHGVFTLYKPFTWQYITYFLGCFFFFINVTELAAILLRWALSGFQFFWCSFLILKAEILFPKLLFPKISIKIPTQKYYFCVISVSFYSPQPKLHSDWLVESTG